MTARWGIEVAVGLFIALGLAALFVLAMQVSNLSALAETQGYGVTARFENIGGLKVRSQVTMAGVRIGRVAAIDFDQDKYEALVTLAIDEKFNKIPTDTTAAIYTSGLLGEQYVGLEPGGSETHLKAGDEIKLTQSALVMERVIGQFLFNKTVQ